jgi:hypothetical protein
MCWSATGHVDAQVPAGAAVDAGGRGGGGGLRDVDHQVGPADIGGPIDWIVLLGVAALGAGGFSILV